jgi:hypothetical protein
MTKHSMVTFDDPVFGLLRFDYTGYRSYALDLFGGPTETLLRVEADGPDDITDGQRRAFVAFREHEAAIVSQVVLALSGYLRAEDAHSDAAGGAPPVDLEDRACRPTLWLRHFCFLYSSSGDRRIGFVFEGGPDPELGIGVLVVDEVVKQAGAQDFVL